MKYDVILINPLYNLLDTVTSEKQDLDDTRNEIYSYPILGLAYIAGSLEKAGYKVKIIDAPALKLSQKEIIELVKKNPQKIVGITTTTHSLFSVSNLVKELKKEVPQTKLVIGGPHITYDPKSVEFLNPDYGIWGEAEESFVKLVGLLESKKQKIENINGLIYKKKGKWLYNKRAYIEDLDSLKFPARHLLPHDKYFFALHSGKFTTMITSRGCLFDCVYCALPDKKVIRNRSTKNIISELKELVRQGYEYVDFQDDFFTYNKKRTIELCSIIIAENLKFSWGCATRVEFVNEELLKLMKKAGCHNIRYGIESGSERVRKIIGKNFTDERIKDVVKITKKAGIKAIFFMSFGHPTETLKDMKKSVKLVQKLKPDYAQYSLINILPGSRLFKIAIKEEIISKDVWKETAVHGKNPIYIPDGSSLDEMMKLQKQALFSFYFNPLFSIKNLLESKSVGEFFTKIKIGISLLKNLSK